MKLVKFTTIQLIALALTFAATGVSRATQDNAYANASLVLTSSNENESATANSNSGVGYAKASAQPGYMTNAVSTAAGAGLGSTGFQDETQSDFKDTLTIVDPALTGLSGTLDFNFLVSGTFSFTAAVPATSSITADATYTGPGGPDDLTYTKRSDGSSSGTPFLGVEQTVVVPFVFGTPFTFDLDVDFLGDVQGLTSGSSSVTGTFSTTASTDNVISLVTLSPASGYTANSASGANYFTNAAAAPQFVPEPGDVSLVLAGLAGLAAFPFLKRRRSSR